MQGRNSYGQLGDGTVTQRTTPNPVPYEGWWLALATGDQHACAIRSDLSLWCWVRPACLELPLFWLHMPCLTSDPTLHPRIEQGYGAYGQLGLGSNANVYAPTQVGTSTDWVYISSSYSYNCGIRSSGGKVYCWGYNNVGQLGDTTTTQRTAPVAVFAAVSMSQVLTSPYGSCTIPGPAPSLTPAVQLPPAPAAPKVPNCWGANTKGQWGDGTILGTSPLPGASNSTVWKQLSMGDVSQCGIMAGSASLYCWGTDASAYGILGDGLTVTRTFPAMVAGGGQWLTVFTATSHVGAVRVLLLGLWCPGGAP